MENKESSSKKKLIYDQQEKDDSQRILGGESNSETAANLATTQLLLDLKILGKKSSNLKPPRRVIVTIESRSPSIKTIFVAEKSRINSKKSSDKSRSLALAIGDHPSFTSHCVEPQGDTKQSVVREPIEKSLNINQVKNKPLQEDLLPHIHNVCETKLEPTEKCCSQIQPAVPSMNNPKTNDLIKASNVPKNSPNFIIAYSSANKNHPGSITQLHEDVHLSEGKVRTQKMDPRTNDPYRSQSSSAEGSDENNMRSGSGSNRPGCSYIDHYSHIPETSAFQRYTQQSIPLSTHKGTTIKKEHNSEQYGRDFTAYDGITARGRRQCVSMTNKRDEHPRHAAERMTKIRHKLNPVRDYKLMDTVHYLAQGEFAPRNDGIKLTPSREAVLSDIIWEDVCRTHWPGARLGRRHHQERSNTRSELQRLIDNLLRERVAHVERRRRRHYRIVKLNHRHETSGGPVGKTDIIVASHKHRHLDDDDVGITANASGGMMSRNRHDLRNEYGHHRCHRSHDRLMSPDPSQRRRVVHEECTPGPSYAIPRTSRKREPTCCYHASSSTRPERPKDFTDKLSSSSTASSERHQTRNPRLVVRKESCKKHHRKEEVNLDHFILLPTLVVRTPSNMKRQKKFNELYHRILNHLSDGQNSTTKPEQTDPKYHHKKD